MSSNREWRRSGEALAEVALVLVIIIVIAAVLYPIFARNRGHHGIRDHCQSNIKECAVAIQLYWTDYDGYLPSSAVVSHSKTWNKRDFLRFATKAGKLPPGPKRSTWVEVVYDKIKRKDIMFCPTDPVDVSDPAAQCSYWWKTAIDKAWYGVGCRKPCRRESDFIYNSDQIILYEHQPFHFGGEGGLVNGALINVAYLDTHVRMHRIVNATSGDPVNCAANSDGEPMYFNFDMNKKKGNGNPPKPRTPAKHTDPNRYSDMLPG